jgi:signal transduction histidine kinase/ligand-binding sensor domain-containing protein/AraC-like DNA-binding protein/AmiR/NasT family two-component response regulator
MLLLLMMGVFTVHGQLKAKIEHYSTEDGLSHDEIMWMIKDHEGFMWFATWDGINRFDGRNFITYKARPGDKSNLKNNRIQYITEDKAGYLWLRAYNKQIYRFDKKKEQFLAVSDLLQGGPQQDISFNQIIPIDVGTVWLTTKNQGIYCVLDLQMGHPRIVRYAADAAAAYRLPSSKIVFFYEDKQHQFWVGTDKGISCLQKDKSGVYKHKVLDAAFSGYNFTGIAEDDGNIWLSTKQGELVAYRKTTGRFFNKKITGQHLNGIRLSGKKQVLYLSASGSQLITVRLPDLQAKAAVMEGGGSFLSLFEDNKGLLWIEPEKQGVVKFDPATEIFKHYIQKNDATYDMPPENYSVFEDNRGTVWVCMKGGGFGYYNLRNDKVEYFYNEPGSPTRQFSNLITCRYYDPSGVLWFSANDRGLNKVVFQRDDFNHKLLVENSLNKSDNDVRSIFHDEQNRLWLAAKVGKLYVTDGGGKRVENLFVNEPKGGLGFVYTVIADKNKNIWLGTKGNGLFKAVPVDQRGSKYKLTHYLADEDDPGSLSSNLIYSLLEDQQGRIWVGTYGEGINLITGTGSETKFINKRNGLSKYPIRAFDKVRHLQEDPSGNIWIATTDGLLLLNPGKEGNAAGFSFKGYRKIAGDQGSLGNNSIQYIYRDSAKRMWVLTSGGGLNLALGKNPLKELKFKVYTKEDGLPNDYLLSCVEDRHGNLWLATENGLSRFNPGNAQFRNYDSYDGIPKTGFSEAAVVKMPDGKLIFGCLNGFISFNPDAVMVHKVNGNMALTNVQINNQDAGPDDTGSPLKININHTREMTLKHSENIISIDYTVLDYRSVNKQVYAYRLTGFDTVWHTNTNQHRATYTNLPAGNYVFEVKSLSNDLYINNPSKTVKITILPAPWRTVWAYLLYLVVAVAVIEMIRRTVVTMIRLRNRIAVERRLSALKLSFFTNISHELRTPLTLILNPIEEIYKKERLSEQGTQYIHVVRKNANRMVRFINQLLDLGKVQSGKATADLTRLEVLGFVRGIGGYFAEVAQEKQITLEVNSNVRELYAWIDADKIDIVLYNLLANAFKFTPEGRGITIEINQDHQKGTFTIAVIDQGVGVPEAQLTDIFELYFEGEKIGYHLKGTGIGLALSKELVDLHGGTIRAENNTQGGLTVTVELKYILTDSDPVHQQQRDDAGDQVADEETSIVQGLTNAGRYVVNGEEHPASDVRAPEENAASPLVLLVEDNVDLRKFLSIQLMGHYRIAEAENGAEGLEKAIRLLPDLVLSDVMMPVLDGVRMLDSLKNNELTSHIPVVLLTARFAVENQIEGLHYGADCYITKPFHQDYLLAAIDNLLKQRRKIFESYVAHKKKIVLAPGEIVITSKDEVFLKEIIRIVENGMANPEFNIDAVAESIGMGRTTFYKKFKSLTNQAPVEFVREMRLKRGMQLLDAGENNVSEIAYSVGFSSAGYFSTCFKEMYHLSPSEYYKSRLTAKTDKISDR